MGFPGGSERKESACNEGDPGSIPGSGRSPGEGNGCPLQYSCLENRRDRGAWWATVHGVAESDSWSDLACTACTGGASGKEPACQCRRHKRSGFHSGVEKIPWRRAWSSLHYSCLENPRGHRSLAATVHRVTKSSTWRKRFTMHASVYILCGMGLLGLPWWLRR